MSPGESDYKPTKIIFVWYSWPFYTEIVEKYGDKVNTRIQHWDDCPIHNEMVWILTNDNFAIGSYSLMNMLKT